MRVVTAPAWVMNMIGASAITVYPFVFLAPEVKGDYKLRVLMHETVHLVQQERWFKRGIGIGLIAWFFLYLLCLPVKYNYFRRKWETEAFLVEGFSPETIKEFLRQRPYYLT